MEGSVVKVEERVKANSSLMRARDVMKGVVRVLMERVQSDSHSRRFYNEREGEAMQVLVYRACSLLTSFFKQCRKRLCASTSIVSSL